MTLKDFINNTLLETGKDLELAKGIENKITEYAKSLVDGHGSVGISDDEVKNLIIKYANDPNAKVEPKKVVEKPKKVESKNEQVSLW